MRRLCTDLLLFVLPVALTAGLVPGFTLICAPALAATELTDYHVGDTVKENIVTLIPFDVIDAEATAARKAQEYLKTPAVFRCYSDITNEVENDFIRVFDDVRAKFQAEVALAFHPIPIDEPTRASEQFGRFVAAFNRNNKTLPVTTHLAGIWAGGADGSAIEATLVSRLRQAMRRHIRAGDSPAGSALGDTLRLVSVASETEAPTLETAEQRGRNVTRASVATLSRARSLLRKKFPGNEQTLARAVAAFLRPDCVLDEALTRQARARQVNQLAVADHFDPGQTIAQRGQVIDRKLKAALDQLHDQTAVGQLNQQIIKEQERAQQVRERNRWLTAALAGASLVSGLAVWRLARRRRQTSLLPALAGVAAGGPPAANESWRQRALDAEWRTEQAQTIIRANLAPYLAQTLKEALIQGLAAQRTELLEAQQRAVYEINELVCRLDELHTPVQERLRTYEQRIEELEKALATRNEEYRELLKLKIEMTRRQAEAERANQELEFS